MSMRPLSRQHLPNSQPTALGSPMMSFDDETYLKPIVIIIIISLTHFLSFSQYRYLIKIHKRPSLQKLTSSLQLFSAFTIRPTQHEYPHYSSLLQNNQRMVRERERVNRRFKRLLDAATMNSNGLDLNRLHSTLFSLEKELGSLKLNRTHSCDLLCAKLDLLLTYIWKHGCHTVFTGIPEQGCSRGHTRYYGVVTCKKGRFPKWS